MANSYKPLKEKYNRLLLEKEELEKRVETVNVSIENSNNPSFLFTDKATNEELYSYLKENPTASRFIFKKYSANQSFLKEICDPENPIHLSEVANSLQGIYHIKEEEKNIEALLHEKSRLSGELEKIKEEIEEAETEYDAIHENLERIRKEDETYNMQRSNVRTDMGLKLIAGNFESISRYFDAIHQKWDVYFKEHGPTSMGMIIEKNDFNQMDVLNRNIREMMERIKSDDFLSPENLDAYHKELMEKVKQEQESSSKEMDTFIAHNPKKSLREIINEIYYVQKRIIEAEDDGYKGKFLTKGNLDIILGNIEDGMKRLNYLMDQVENVNRRNK